MRSTAISSPGTPTPSGTISDTAVGPRLDALTGLRIFAAAFVYFSHIAPPKDAPGWVSTFLGSGYMGVTLFFVLSGFVLSLNYAETLQRPTTEKVWAFFGARFARVYPVYALVLTYVIVRSRMAGDGSDHWLAHAFALQAWNPSIDVAYALNPPAWSVSVEVFLYAMFPLTCLALARIRSTRVLLVIAGGVVALMVGLAWWFAAGSQAGLPIDDAGSAHRWLYRSPIGRLGDFVLGFLAARVYVAVRPGDRQIIRLAGWSASLAAGFILTAMCVGGLQGTTWSFDVLYAVPTTVLILGLALAPRAPLARVLARPRIVLFGEASYAFYLIHFLLIGMLGAGAWSRHVTVMSVTFEAMTFGIVLVAALGIHVVVERPARIRLRRILVRNGRHDTPARAGI